VPSRAIDTATSVSAVRRLTLAERIMGILLDQETARSIKPRRETPPAKVCARVAFA
jgi:hypothetical protein